MTNSLNLAEQDFLRRLVYEVSHEPFTGSAVEAIGSLGIATEELSPLLGQFNALPHDFPHDTPPPSVAIPWESRGQAMQRATGISQVCSADSACTELSVVEVEIDSCIRQLGNDDFAAQERAITRLRNLGGAAIQALVRGLATCDGYTNRLICDALSEIGSDAFQSLSELLESDEDYSREWAVIALGAGRLTAKPALVQLRKAVEDRATFVRLEAVRVLNEIGEGLESDVQVLVDCLSDPDSLVRVRSASYLAEFGARTVRLAIPALVRAIGDPHPDVRCYAAEALGRLNPLPEDAAEAIFARLQEGDALVRQAAEVSLFGPQNDRFPNARYRCKDG